MRGARRTVFATLAAAILIAALLAPAAADPIDGVYTASVDPNTVEASKATTPNSETLTYTITNQAPDSATVITDATIALAGITAADNPALPTTTTSPLGSCSASLSNNQITINCDPGVVTSFSVSVSVTGTVTTLPGQYAQLTSASSDLTGREADGNDPVLTVVDEQEPCAGDPLLINTCESTVDKRTTENMTVKMTVHPGAFDVTYDLSVGGDWWKETDGTTTEDPCGPTFDGQASIIRSNVSGDEVTGRAHTIDVTIYKVRPHLIQNGVDQWQVCFASDTEGWITASGEPAQDNNGDGLHEGILRQDPACSAAVAPCLVFKKRNAGNVVLRYIAPAGDPLGIPGTGSL